MGLFFISLSSVWQYGSDSSFLLVTEMVHFHFEPILPLCLYDIVYSCILNNICRFHFYYHLNKVYGVWGRLRQKFDSIPSGCSKIWSRINGDSWYMVLAAKGENGETEVVNINGWKTACVLQCTVECLKVRLLYCDWGREPKRRVRK